MRISLDELKDLANAKKMKIQWFQEGDLYYLGIPGEKETATVRSNNINPPKDITVDIADNPDIFESTPLE